jgi:hypothetical protein
VTLTPERCLHEHGYRSSSTNEGCEASISPRNARGYRVCLGGMWWIECCAPNDNHVHHFDHHRAIDHRPIRRGGVPIAMPNQSASGLTGCKRCCARQYRPDNSVYERQPNPLHRIRLPRSCRPQCSRWPGRSGDPLTERDGWRPPKQHHFGSRSNAGSRPDWVGRNRRQR